MRLFWLILIVFMVMSADAYAQQGLFGGRAKQDGSISMRRSTTEQFNPVRGQSVTERPRPDFDPTPIGLGSFQLFPILDTGIYYDSNIYANAGATHDDAVWKITPSLSAVSDWGRHALAFTGFADIGHYAFNGDESYHGGAAQLDGRFDITDRTWVGMNAGYQRNTEPRSSPSLLGAAAEPTQYDMFLAGIEGYRGLGTLKAKVNYDLSYRDYDPVALTGGGTANLSARNRIQHGFTTELEYEVTENLKPFMRGGFDFINYTSNNLRSSDGYELSFGARMDFGGVITAEASIGYEGRDYYNFAGSDVDIVDFEGRVLWNVTGLTSVEAEVGRSIEETTLGGATNPLAPTSYIATGGSVTLTHELLRELILEANLSFTNNDYQQAARDDDNAGAGAGMRYFFNRNLYTDLTYDFTKRMSNAVGADFDRHVTFVRLGAHY